MWAFFITAMSALLVFCASAAPSRADYIATGPIEGWYCSGFVIKACDFQKLDRVYQSGLFHEIRKKYDDVDEAHDGKCWVKVGDSRASLGVLSSVGLPDFYLGSTNYGVPDFIYFPCKRTP